MSSIPRGIDGVIHPPKEIADIVEKTAQFIARHGTHREADLRNADPKKLSFMDTANPFYTYYLSRLEEWKMKVNDGTDVQEAKPAAQPAAPQPTQQSSARAKVAKLRPNPLPKEHTVDLTDISISAAELDLIKHTAYYVARHGKAVVSQIVEDREQNGVKFDFLKGSSTRFPIYQKFLSAYARILDTPRGMLEVLEEDVQDRMSALTTAKEVIEWRRADDESRKNKESEAEKQRALFQSIDWQDFVVVETIEFQDTAATPAPPVPPAARATPPPVPQAPAPAPAALPSVGAPPPPPSVPTADVGAQLRPPPPSRPAAPAAPVPTVKKSTTVVTVLDEDEDVSGQVRGDYVRDTSNSRKRKATVLDHTGREISIDDAAEHMRRSTIDPQWHQQKMRRQEDLAVSGLASESETAKTLERMAKSRPDN